MNPEVSHKPSRHHSNDAKLTDDLWRSQRMKDRPVCEIRDRIVWTIIAAPPLDTEKIASLIEIVIQEFETGLGISAQQLSFQECPGWRRHGSINHHTNLTSC